MTWASGFVERNPVCRVHFEGWISTTLDLQRAGWQVSASQQLFQHSAAPTVQLALHHPKLQLSAITNPVSYKPWLAAGFERRYGAELEFHVVAMAHDLRFAVITQPKAQWHAVDCFPEAFTQRMEERSIHDVVPFRPINHDAEQIIVSPDSVPKVLDLLLACQAPTQQKIREGERRRSSDISAQIITLVA